MRLRLGAAVALVVLGMMGPGAADAGVEEKAQAPIRFVERPGEMRFSGRMIAKVRRVEALQAEPGLAGRAAEVEAAARARLAPMMIRHVAPTDEYLLRVPAGETENELGARLMATGEYEYVEPDWIVSPVTTPNDPDFADQWQHTAMQTALAWDTTTGSDVIICAPCDTGVDLDHPDLAAALVPGVNTAGFSTPVAQVDGGLVDDINGHGTFVGGCMAAIGNNGVGVSGCGWSFRLMPVRVTNLSNGDASLSDITEGAIWASEHGAKIINCSYSGVSASTVETAGATVRANGALLFWAAGNDHADLSGFDHADVIVVGATDSNDNKASFSAYGVGVDLFAPGVEVYSTRAGGGFGSGSGTSFATPLAGGVAGLLWSVNPMMTPSEVEQLLFDGCDDLGTPGDDDFWGHGRVNAYQSMGLVTPPSSEPGAFSLVAPAVGATSTGLSVHLEWTDSSDAGWYEVQVDDDPAFGSPEVDAAAYATHYDVPFLTLEYYTTYHWRVTAHNVNGSTPMDVAGGDASFSTGLPPLPGPFALLSPAIGATSVELTPTLTWEASVAAEEYRVLVADDPSSYTSPIVDVRVGWEDPEYSVPYATLTYDMTYYWRVLAHATGGWTVCEPADGSFTTVPPPAPEAFELISPAEGEEDVPTGPTFTWSESRNAESYVLEVGTDSAFTEPIISQFMYAQNLGGYGEGMVGYQAADGTLPEGQTLYWRVTASNTWGEQVGAPEVASFMTAPPPGCVADIDGDGDSDVFDFGIFVLNFGHTGVGPSEGDLDGDGAVTVGDFGIFALGFGCRP